MTQHKHIPLPANWQDLALGELISVAMSLGVGNVDEETGEMVSWGTTTLVEAITTNQIRRFGNKAKYVQASTIESWLTADSSGPGPMYWLDLLAVLCSPHRSADVNRAWEKALLQLRSNALAEKKERKRKPIDPDMPKVAPKKPTTSIIFDPSAFDHILQSREAQFATGETNTQRLWGHYRSLSGPLDTTSASELAWVLLKKVALRTALWVEAGQEHDVPEWLYWNATVDLNIATKGNALSAAHLDHPDDHSLCQNLFDRFQAYQSELDSEIFAQQFSHAFFAELGHNLGSYLPLVQALVAGLRDSDDRIASLQFECHHNLTKADLSSPMLADRFARGGEPFSVLDMYVDLPTEPDVGDMADYDETYGDEDKERPLTSELFRSLVTDRWSNAADDANFLCIRGLPGSGKSTASKWNANLLQLADKDLAVVFLPLQRHGPFRSDDQTLIIRGETPPGFVFSSQALDVVTLFNQSRFKRLLIILDGLDELGSQTEHQTQIEQLSRALRCVDQSPKPKPIKFVLAGRHQAFKHLRYPAKPDEDVYRLVGMALPKLAFHSDGPRIEESELSYVFDHRMLWFRRFMRFKYGIADPKLPEVLVSHFHQLVELTKEPLLIFLLFRLGENLSQQLHFFTDEGTQVPDFDRIFEMGDLLSLSRNDLFQMMIWSIRNPVHRTPAEIERPSSQGGLPENNFEKTLSCLAMAAWRNGTGRRATVGEFLAEADRQGLRREALRFVSIARGREPDSEYANLTLLSVFYFQGFRREGSDEDEFEFTHKSFSDYLVATTIFEDVIRLAGLVGTHDLRPEDSRIEHLASLIGHGEETIELCQFFQEEAIRYGRKRTIIFETLNGPKHLYPRQGQELPLIDVKALEAIVWNMAKAGHVRATRIVTAIWNAVVEGDVSGRHGLISPSDFSFADLYRRIADPIRFDDLAEINSALLEPDISKYSITNWDLDEGDLTALNLMNATFTNCTMVNAKIAATPLSNTGFNHCDLSGAFFVNCDLTSSNFFHSSGFEATLCQMKLSIFEDAKFNNCRFDQLDVSDTEWITCTFEGCMFAFCDFSKATFNSVLFKDCHFAFCGFDEVEHQGLVLDNCTFAQCNNSADLKDAPEDVSVH